jgi:hypothetical protein
MQRKIDTEKAGNEHGFLYDGGTFTTLDNPSGIGRTELRGINNSGDVVGSYPDSVGHSHGSGKVARRNSMGYKYQSLPGLAMSNATAAGLFVFASLVFIAAAVMIVRAYLKHRE